MTRLPKALAVAAVAAIVGAACGPAGGGPSEELAADQTLRFVMQDDVESLDPAHVSAATDITFLQHVFTGLVKFDNKLNIVADGAEKLPDISSDGLKYTFKLRKDVKFSNGDPVTAKDWLYSFNRTARLNDAYASNLEPIKGTADVEKGKAKTISGLTAPDDFTLVAVLDQPAAYWLTQLAMPTAALVVNQKVIESAGEDNWWTKPETYIGSGPFKMTKRTPKQVMEFEPVANWWGGSTGALKKIHVDIGIDLASGVKKFESGGLDIVGMANQPMGSDDILRYQNDPAKKKLLTIYPGARTTGIGFNMVKGPFAAAPGVTPGQPTSKANDPGLDGRRAFSMAIDRTQLADVACAKGSTCAPATGGYISKGLKGYLGDGGDESAKFDKAAAKALYEKWDPDHKKVQGLQLRYNATPFNNKVWANVQAQWQENLGVKVDLAPSDFPTLQRDRKAKNAIIYRESWSADYDHPQDWFDNIYICSQAQVGRGNYTGYCNKQLDDLTSRANALPLSQSEQMYKDAQKLLIKDIVWGNLFYGTQPYLVQDYVKGTGYNALYDFSWLGTKILKH